MVNRGVFGPHRTHPYGPGPTSKSEILLAGHTFNWRPAHRRPSDAMARLIPSRLPLDRRILYPLLVLTGRHLKFNAVDRSPPE